MSSSNIPVTVQIADRQGELEIVDGGFRVIAQGFGSLQFSLAPGIYKARARAGTVLTEKLFDVTDGGDPVSVLFEPLFFASPVPLNGTSTSHEYHQHAISVASAGAPLDAGLGRGAIFLISVRDPSDACMRQRTATQDVRDNYRRSFDGFRLHSAAGNMLLDFDAHAKRDVDLGFAVLNVHLQPGTYVLSYKMQDSERIAMPITVVQGWQTQAFIHVDLPADMGAPGRADLTDLALLMTPVGTLFSPGDTLFRLAELARLSLTQGRFAITNAQVDELLAEKFSHPILGLLVAHLLLLQDKPQCHLLETVIDHVAVMLGPDFPDVIAMRIAMARLDDKPSVFPTDRLTAPPLLRTNWDLLAAYPEFLPADSLNREIASCIIHRGLWLNWNPPLPTPKTVTLVKNVMAIMVKLSARVKEKQPEDVDDESAALAAINILIKTIRWRAVLKALSKSAKKHGLMTNFTSLQKSLMPTMQIIQTQFEDQENFTLEDLKQLCDDLGVPMPVLRESLEDLAGKMIGLAKKVLKNKMDSDI